MSLPSSVVNVPSKAFADCSNLKDVFCHVEEVPSTAADAFANLTLSQMTLHVPEEAVDEYGMIASWSQFGRIVSIPKHTLTYMVDGEVYKTVEVEEGEEIIQEAEPTKEGYTFSGWDMVPANMPAHDVTATGSFTINSYTLT